MTVLPAAVLGRSPGQSPSRTGRVSVLPGCSPENLASARVLEKVGRVPEGHLRDYLWVRGAWRDSLLYARIMQD